MTRRPVQGDMEADTDRWTRKDCLWGLLFLGVGLLILALVGSAFVKGDPDILELLGGTGALLLGAVFAVLGLNATFRGLRGR